MGLKAYLRDWGKLEPTQGKPWRSRNEVGILRGNEEPNAGHREGCVRELEK